MIIGIDTYHIYSMTGLLMYEPYIMIIDASVQ
jgi:hypothetical protein